ncbi:MAG: hypothetical protein K6G55_08375 [Selenomonadaceae bacterium]|nr:hypothetical protein [Selenomonadaceae bacterium]
MNSSNVKSIALFVISNLICVMVILGCSPSDKNTHATSIQAEQINPADVKTYKLNNSSLQIAVPFEMKETPEEVQDMKNMNEARENEAVDQILIYKGTAQSGNVDVKIFATDFNKEKIEGEMGEPFNPNIEGALQGAIAHLANSEKFKSFKKKDPIRDITVNGMNGKEFTASIEYKSNKDEEAGLSEVRMVAFLKGEEMWMVGALRDDSDDAKKVTDTIINSIEIK